MANERVYLVSINYGLTKNSFKYAVNAMTVYEAGDKAEKQFEADHKSEFEILDQANFLDVQHAIKAYRVTSIQESGYVFIQ